MGSKINRLEWNINFIRGDQFKTLGKPPQAYNLSRDKSTLLGIFPTVRHHFVVYLSYSNTYIYEVYLYLGRRLYDKFVRRRILPKGAIKDEHLWEYGKIDEHGNRKTTTRKNGNLYHIFSRPDLGIVLEVPEIAIHPSSSLKNLEKHPIILHHPKGTITIQLLFRNTLDASYVRPDYTRMTIRIDTYGSFYIFPILQDILTLPNRNIDFSHKLLRIKLLVPEVYVRFRRYTSRNGKLVDHLLEINEMLNVMRIKNGTYQNLNSKGQIDDLNEHSNIVDIVWRGRKIRLKLYLSKKHPWRDPKLEIVLREPIELSQDEFINAEKFFKKAEKARKGINLISGILGAIVKHYQLTLSWDLEEDDKYFSHPIHPDEGFLAYLRGLDIHEYLFSRGRFHPDLDDLDIQILKVIIERTAVTVQILSKILSKSECTIRRRLKKLKELGYITSTEQKRPNYYWLSEYEELSNNSSNEEEPLLYIDPEFEKYVSSLLLETLSMNSNSDIDSEDIKNIVLLLWAIASGWDTHIRLLKFIKFLQKHLGFKRLTKKTIDAYLRLLRSARLITIETFKAEKNKIVQYRVHPNLLRKVFEVDYYRVLGT